MCFNVNLGALVAYEIMFMQYCANVRVQLGPHTVSIHLLYAVMSLLHLC